MARIAWSSLPFLLLGLTAFAQDEEVLILDEISIDGQMREPSVAIFTTRMLPEFEGFRMEKSFFDQVRSPDAELVELDPALGNEHKVENAEAMLNRNRHAGPMPHPPMLLPAQQAGTLKTTDKNADQTGSTEDNGNDPTETR